MFVYVDYYVWVLVVEIVYVFDCVVDVYVGGGDVLCCCVEVVDGKCVVLVGCVEDEVFLLVEC